MEEILFKDIRAAAKACTEASIARKAAEAAESKKKSAMMKVFEPLLGVKSEEEVAALSPEELARRAMKRFRAGLFSMEKGGISVEELLIKVIQKTQSRRSVSWKDAYVAEMGESKATQLTSATEESFSYKFLLNECGAK